MASNKKLTVEIGAKVFGASDVANLGKSIKGLDAAVRPAASAIEELKAQAQKLASRSGATANELRSAISIYENLKDVVALNGKEHSEFSREITTISNKLNPFKQKVASLRQEYNASTNSLKRYNDELQRNNSYAARYLRGGATRLEIPKPRQQLMLPPGRTDKQRRELFGGLRFDQMMQGMSLDSSGQPRFDLRPGFDRITPGMRSYGFSGKPEPPYASTLSGFRNQFRPTVPVIPTEPQRGAVIPDDALLDLTNYEGGLRRTRQEIQKYQAEQRKFTESNRRAGISTRDIIGQLDQFARTSNKSTSALQFQRDQLNQLRSTLAPIDDQYDKITKSIERLDKQLEKRSVGSNARRGQQMSSIVGTTLAAGVFGGPEGFLGGAIGGGLELAGALGPGGAITGAAIGATVNQFRKFLGTVTETYSEVARLNIGIRQLNTVQGDAAASSENIQLALGAVQERAATANQSIAETTKSFLRLNAAVKGSGGSVQLATQAYKSVSDAITATGGSTEDAKAAVVALSQVYSKGKLSAEELTQQLAERLSGAVTLFAEATGRTLPKLQDDLKKGLVGLEDVVTFQFALQEKFSYTAFEMATSSVAAGARMTSAFEQASISIGQALQPIGAEFQDLFARITIGAIQTANTLGILERRPFEKDGEVDVTARRAYDIKTGTASARSFLRRQANRKGDGDLYGSDSSVDKFYSEASERASAGVLLKEIDKVVSQLDPQKNLQGKEQNLNAYKSLIKTLEEVTTDSDSALKGSVTLTKKIQEFAKEVKRLEQEVKPLRKEAAALFAAGFKETSEQGIKDEAERKARADNIRAQEKLYGLQETLGRRIQTTREAGEEKVRRIREEALRQYERLEEQIINVRKNAARDLEDRQINLQRLQEDAARPKGLSGEARQLQDELISIDRQYEDDKRKLQREQQDRELDITEQIIKIEENSRNQIMRAQRATAREIGNMQRKYAQDVEKILLAGQNKRVKIEQNLLNLQVLTNERAGLNAKYYGQTGNVVPLPGVGQQGYGPEFEANNDARFKQIKKLDVMIARAFSALKEQNSGLIDFGQTIKREFTAPVSEFVSTTTDNFKEIRAEVEELSQARQRSAKDVASVRTSSAIKAAADNFIKGFEDELKKAQEDNADRLAANALVNQGYESKVAGELVGVDRDKQTGLERAQELAEVMRQGSSDPAVVQAIANEEERMRQAVEATAIGKKEIVLSNEEIRRSGEEVLRTQERLKELANGIANSIGNGIGQAMSLVIEGTKNWGDSLREIASGVLKDIASQIMQMLVIKPLVGAIGGGLKDLFGVGNVTGNAMGNAYAKNKIVPYSKGGVINSPMLFKFAKGGMLETGLAGEAGPEGILPLKRTRSGDLGVQSSGGGSTVINVKVDASGSSVQGDAPKADMLGKAIAKAVNQEIIKQKRAGGLLA